MFLVQGPVKQLHVSNLLHSISFSSVLFKLADKRNSLGLQRQHIELPVRTKKKLFSHFHFLSYIVSFFGGKKQTYINCLVSDNRKPGNSS